MKKAILPLFLNEEKISIWLANLISKIFPSDFAIHQFALNFPLGFLPESSRCPANRLSKRLLVSMPKTMQSRREIRNR